MFADLKSKIFLFLLILSLTYTKIMPSWNFEKGGEDWPKSCKNHNQAPLDLAAPFQFKDTDREFFYSKMMTEYAFYNNGNNLILEGDFGYMIYNNETFFSSEIYFYSPSMHSIGMHKMPLEMQVMHHDKKGNKISISILFIYSSDYSLFLGKLGFDNQNLRHMKPFQPKIIREDVDISQYIGNEKDFFYYESLDMAPPCTAKTTYMILTDVLKVSKEQLNNFPKIIKNKSRNIQLRRNRVLYTTFEFKEVGKKMKKLKDEMDKMKKEKEAEKKYNLLKLKLVRKTMPKKGVPKKLKLKELMRLNMTINQTIIKKLNNYNRNNTDNTTDNCTVMTPIDGVKEQIKAIDKYKQVTKVKIYNLPNEKKNETMVIDYDFPRSDAELKRLSVEEKEKMLSTLYNKSKENPKNVGFLIQIDKLEKQIKTDIINSIPETNYFSFLVMDNQILDENSMLEKESKIKNNIENFEMMRDVMNININDRFDSQSEMIKQEKILQKENELLFKNINEKSNNISILNENIQKKNVPIKSAAEYVTIPHIKSAAEDITKASFKRASEDVTNSPVSSSTTPEDNTSLKAITMKENEENRKLQEVINSFKHGNNDKTLDLNVEQSARKYADEMNNFGKKTSTNNESKDESTNSTPQKTVKDIRNYKIENSQNQKKSSQEEIVDNFSNIKIHKSNLFESLFKKNDNIQNSKITNQSSNESNNSFKIIAPQPNKSTEINDIIKPRTVVEKISQEKINPIEKKSSNIVNHHSVIQKASKIVNKEVSPSMSNEKISNDDKEKPKEKLKEKPKEKLKHEIKSVNAPKAKDKIEIKKHQDKKLSSSKKENINSVSAVKLKQKVPSKNNIEEDDLSTFKSIRRGMKFKIKLPKRNKDDDLSSLNSIRKRGMKLSMRLQPNKDEMKSLKDEIQKGKKLSEKLNHKDDLSSLREEILKGKKLSATYNNIINNFLNDKKNEKNNEIINLLKKSAAKTIKPKKIDSKHEEDPQIAKLDELKNKVDKLNQKVHNKKSRVLVPPQTDLKKEIKEMTKKNDEIISKVILKPNKVLANDLNKSYLTDLDFDKIIFNFLKIVYDNLTKEFSQLDKINQSLYDCENGLLNSEGFIKITKKNFALIVKKAYELNYHEELNYENKLNQIYDFAYKTLIIQSKYLESHPLSELRHLTLRDIESLLNRIVMKGDDNQVTIKETKPKVKVLVLEILQNLPLILLTTNPDQKSYIATKDGQVKYSETKNEHVYDNSIITRANSNLFRRAKIKSLVLGPNIRQMSQVKAPVGQGRKAVSRDGKIDPTEIFDITNWPDSCKTNKRQSPININRPYEPLSVGIEMKYTSPSGPVIFLNDGFKLILRGSFGSLFYGAHQYNAVEIHFHSPSEHTFGDDEKRSPLEMQIIHQDIFGNLAAVAVLFNPSLNENLFLKQLGFGVDNPLFAMRLRNSGVIELKASEHLNIGKYLNKISHYVHYVGSITSPPCNENVQWFVLLEKLGITQRQLEYFPVLFGMESNVRGLQENINRIQEII